MGVVLVSASSILQPLAEGGDYEPRLSNPL